jgi:hypothetical protein
MKQIKELLLVVFCGGAGTLLGIAHGATLIGQANVITLTGGSLGQGFSPLGVNVQSFHVGGSTITIQGITFGPELPHIKFPSDLQEDTYNAGGNINAGTLGFTGSTQDDLNMISLLQGFRYVGGNTIFDVAANTNYVQYTLSGLTIGQTYQLDLFTVADSNPRYTQFQVIGGDTYQDNLETTMTAKILQYALTPDASGNIYIQYGFGGAGSDGSGLLSAVSLTMSIPEPSTWALLLCGFILICGIALPQRAGSR